MSVPRIIIIVVLRPSEALRHMNFFGGGNHPILPQAHTAMPPPGEWQEPFFDGASDLLHQKNASPSSLHVCEGPATHSGAKNPPPPP